MNISEMNLTNVEMGGVDMADYPDFCDAYVDSCDVNGVEATDEQLDMINEDSDFIYEQLEDYMGGLYDWASMIHDDRYVGMDC